MTSANGHLTHTNNLIVEEKETNLMSVVIVFYLISSMLAEHVSDINTSIIRNLRLFYCITTLVVCGNPATPKQEHTTNVVIQ